MNRCPICHDPNNGSGYSMEGGFAHRHCYEKQNPPRVAQTLYQMARGCGDPVLAAEVIAEMIPAQLAESMVTEFNRRLVMQWQRRCEP